MIFSHFAEILTLSLDGASENGRVGLGGEAMCGNNSQMDQLMIRRAIWSEVKLRAEATGVDDLLNRFYKNDDRVAKNAGANTVRLPTRGESS